MPDFDAIIIGSGIGGMTCAGILAARGMTSLVLEAHRRPGGYMTSFKRKDFLFDSAVDCISGVQPGGVLGNVLSLLDVDKRLELIQVDPVRSSIFPDFTIDVDTEEEAYMERLISMFPGERKGIEGFFKAAGRIYEDIRQQTDAFGRQTSPVRGISSEILKAVNVTYEDMLHDFVHDFRLKAVLSDRCPFLGLSPSEVGAIPMIVLVMSYFSQKAYRPKGGFQTLSDLMTEGIRKKGGVVLFGKEVVKIVKDGNVCTGVVCSDGAEYSSRWVISNADYITSHKQLLGGDHMRSADEMAGRPGVSNSFFIVYGAFRGDFRRTSSIGYFPSYEMGSFFHYEPAYRDEGTIGITVATVEDSSRAPAGHHTIVLHELAEGKGWCLDRERCTEAVMKKAETALPELRGRINVIDTATPRTLERYTRNHNGAAFGWRQIPGNFAGGRQEWENLYFAGHWSGMGGGVLAAACSGAKAAADILAKEGINLVC